MSYSSIVIQFLIIKIILDYYDTQSLMYGFHNIPDELLRKHELKRRYNAVRLDRQSSDKCRKRKALMPRTPPMTLYEKSSFVDELQRKQTGKYYLLCIFLIGIELSLFKMKEFSGVTTNIYIYIYINEMYFIITLVLISENSTLLKLGVNNKKFD